MNYCRKPINKTVDDIKLQMQIGPLTLKLSENNEKIDDLLEVDKNIKKDVGNNLNLIYSNVENISKNDDEIIDIKNNLSNIENTIINHNTDIIKIPDIENDILTINSNINYLPNMKTTLNNLKYRQSAINIILNRLTPLQNVVKDNSSNITNNTSVIDNHANNIKTINSSLTDLKKDISSIEENNLKISNSVFNDKYDIEKQSLNFNKNSHSYILFQKVFEYDFNTYGELIINTIINYKYDNLENDINRLTHLYEYFYDKNVLLYSITLDNHDFGVPSNSDKNILNTDDNFCFNINNKNNIKLVLSLTRINQWGIDNIKLKMIDDNYINIAYKV